MTSRSGSAPQRGRRGGSRIAAALLGAFLLTGALAACAVATTPGPAPTPVVAGVTVPPPTASIAAGSPQETAALGSSSPVAASAGVPSAAPDHKYSCAKLITDAEMQQATGLSSAAFFKQELWTDTPGLPEGETYCQFFAGQGATSIALTIATGPAFTVFETALVAAGSAGAVDLPGIGEHASFAANHWGGARSHGVLVLLKFTDMSADGTGLAGLDFKAAFSQVLTIVVGRL